MRGAAGAVLLAGLCACSARAAMVSSVVEAAGPTRIPKVLGCYEEAFEAGDFQGEFDATVDLLVEGDTGQVREAKVTRLSASKGQPPEALGTCIEKALRESRILPGGTPPGSDLDLRGLRLAFRDATATTRASAATSGERFLVGPRSDRCLGLFSYAPPRLAPELVQELEDAKAKAARATDDPDARARALQRAYDVALELRKRLELDGWQPGVAEESRRRMATELASVERTAIELGAQIGCTPRAE